MSNDVFEDRLGPSTRCVWGDRSGVAPEGVTVVPVFHGVTFAYDDLDEWAAVGRGEKPGHVYSRNTNPTVDDFESRMRLLEDAEDATSFATGMAAISNTLFTLLSPGERVVAIKDTYGGTNKLFIEFLPRFNVDVALCDTTDFDAIEAEIEKGCKVVYLESPTNPTLKVVDIARLAAKAHAAGAIVVVDNTFSTPINQQPLKLGADLVVHSATKFLGGHSDAMGGVVCGARTLVRQIFHFREINGATLDAMSAFLLSRGLKTLELRVARQNRNAQAVAEFLTAHPRVEAVYYPGLPDHPGHDTARRQMSGYGGVLAFSVAGDFDAVRELIARMRLAHCAASLGSVGTLVGPPATTSHVELSAAERADAGIPETLIRYSVGVENHEDLIADLEQALEPLKS